MNKILTTIRDVSDQSGSLINLYTPESSVYFSSSERALLAQPPFASLLVTGMKDVNQQVQETLRMAKELGYGNPIVIGAIPFNVQEKASLKLCTNIKSEKKSKEQGKEQGKEKESVNIGEYTIASTPSSKQYTTGVKDALSRFVSSKLDKVVLSRTLEIDCKSKPNISAMLKNLSSKNTHGYTFAINLEDNLSGLPGNKTLLGASPELLISRKGNVIIANPLAGSEPRLSDPEKDRSQAQKLLLSKKDRYEHELVVRDIKKNLMPFCRTLNVPEEPSLFHTETMWHLGTRIEGELIDPSISSLDLALAMHPTPAVCGSPRKEARDAIYEIEPHDRGLYTGMVGWCDSNGDGEWAVTIRCAEVDANKIKLFAGAGIVPDSIPEKELAETTAKFKTMLNALGI